jgi:pSer/pThr/pTyr-binding forkhead associated (FHA) protein
LIEPCAFSLRLPARQAHLVLGRAPDCDLVIEEAALSLTHLVLLHGPRGWMVQDAASTNGTRLDGQPLIQARAYPLCDGARLEAGLARLTFHEAAGMARRLSRLARRSA